MDNGASVFNSDIIELEGAGNKKSEIKVTYIANMGFHGFIGIKNSIN